VNATLAFAAAVSVLIAIPGPSVLFTVGRALSVGRWGALLTAVGRAAGAYLLYLGAQAIRHRRGQPTGTQTMAVPTRTLKALRDGFVVGVTNPKMVVFLAAALPQFVDRGAGRQPLQMLLLGTVVPVVALVSDSLWALAAGTARSWFAGSPRRVEVLGASGGLAMVGLGAGVALSGRTD
jgi:threonine/homoserine/homoserine lactone efflux protein